jgi:hypothetical protein
MIQRHNPKRPCIAEILKINTEIQLVAVLVDLGALGAYKKFRLGLKIFKL